MPQLWSCSLTPLILLMIIGVVGVVVSARRSDHPWAKSFRFYVWLGVAAVFLRVLFRVVLGGGYPGAVVLDLPQLPLPLAAWPLQPPPRWSWP